MTFYKLTLFKVRFCVLLKLVLLSCYFKAKVLRVKCEEKRTFSFHSQLACLTVGFLCVECMTNVNYFLLRACERVVFVAAQVFTKCA